MFALFPWSHKGLTMMVIGYVWIEGLVEEKWKVNGSNSSDIIFVHFFSFTSANPFLDPWSNTTLGYFFLEFVSELFSGLLLS